MFTRRDLFKNIIPKISNSHTRMATPILSFDIQKNGQITKDIKPLWISIGNLSDYQPGTTYSVGSEKYFLECRGDGLRAIEGSNTVTQTSIIRPLKIERDGSLWIDSMGKWPQNAVLSWLTGSQSTIQEDES